MKVPDEILYEIFRFLESPQDLVCCSWVCLKWNGAVNQPRLWRRIDLSMLSSKQLEKLQWQQYLGGEGDEALVRKLQTAQCIEVLHPTYISPCDLEYIHPLVVRNKKLESFMLERVQVCPDNKYALRLFRSMPSTVRKLSLRQTLVKPGMTAELLERLPMLAELDLSYTLVNDSTLAAVSKYCRNLEKLFFDGVYTLSGSAYKQFLVHDGPTSLRILSLKYACSLNPDWIFAFIKRQLRQSQQHKLERVYVEGCELVTLKDIASLDSLTLGECRISHSAILTEDTLEGYRDLIERLSLNVVNHKTL